MIVLNKDGKGYIAAKNHSDCDIYIDKRASGITYDSKGTPYVYRGVVTAVMYVKKDTIMNEVRSRVNKDSGNMFRIRNIKGIKNCKVVGVAYCSAEDAFDVQTGIDIARRRCYAEYRGKVKDACRKVMNTMGRCVVGMSKKYDIDIEH